MNLPTQSICFPSDAASCLPIATRSILSPSMTTVAFGNTLPSAGLITVPPTSESFSVRPVSVELNNAIAATITVLLFMRMESNLASWRFRWCHQFTNRVKHDFELSIVFLFERIELARKICVGKQHLAQTHKCAHDRNVNVHRAGAAQHAG